MSKGKDERKDEPRLLILFDILKHGNIVTCLLGSECLKVVSRDSAILVSAFRQQMVWQKPSYPLVIANVSYLLSRQK